MEAKKRRRSYDSDFKREAVNLYQTSNKSSTQIEKELGIGNGILRRWVREYNEDPRNSFRGNGNMLPTELEFKKLKKEISHLKKERDILKKAVGIFSQNPNRYMDL